MHCYLYWKKEQQQKKNKKKTPKTIKQTDKHNKKTSTYRLNGPNEKRKLNQSAIY